MDVTSATRPNPTTGVNKEDVIFNPKGILGKDDFLQLLITELRYQDPTDPMDTEKILNQTSQLATLEAQTNTNETMKEVSEAFRSSSQFNAIGAIGKIADLGNSDIRLDESGDVAFDIFFPKEAIGGTLQITDASGNVVKNVSLPAIGAGVHPFKWDGSDGSGNRVDAGVYQVHVNYTSPSGEQLRTRVGTYPIESVRFEGSEALLKLGSHYVPLAQIKEVYGG